jgi:hypothetical protein
MGCKVKRATNTIIYNIRKAVKHIYGIERSMLKRKTVPNLLNIKLSEKGFYEPDISPAESPSVDDPPARREFRGFGFGVAT